MGGCGRMGSDDDFPIRQVLPIGSRFCCWAHWVRFFIFQNMYITSYNIFSHNISFINIGGCRDGWISQQLSYLR